MRRRATGRISVCLGLVLATLSTAADSGDKIDFEKQVYSLFRAKCFSCHGADTQEGQLRLDARAPALQGGVTGRLVVPGKVKESLLWKRVAGGSDDDRMPLDEPPLTKSEMTLISRWIESGASWPESIGPRVAPRKSHWAYQPPRRPSLPSVKNVSWPANALDYFVLHQLEQRQRVPASRAERARLLRRVYLDLVGVPPTIDEVEQFERDRTPKAWERVVDRLLASPRYGERWARPWLDIARYADSNGYQADQYRNVWPYRDWVIKAMNADMPFDEFTIDQLAGDLRSPASLPQRIATGFHRLTTCNVEAGVDPEQNRVNQVVDRVNVTGTVWLGTTIECMQCHNHKYDPFTQRDYYKIFAYFNNTAIEVSGNGVTYNFIGPRLDLPYDQESHLRRVTLQAAVKRLETQLASAKKTRLTQQAVWEKRMLTKDKVGEEWHLLKVTSFASQGGASHQVLKDGSVLLTGKNPDKDIVTVTTETDVRQISGLKLETLTHPSLPGKGPGRGDAARPNFVLQELTATAAPKNSPTSRSVVALHSALADFSQGRFAVRGAIDGKPLTAWAINPQFGKPHEASFLTRSPLGFEGGTVITVSLRQQFGGKRTIGRLRLWAMTGTRAKGGLPAAIAKTLRTPPKKRTKAAATKLSNYFLMQDTEIGKLNKQLAAERKKLTTIKPVTTLAMVENTPRKTMIFRRGNFKSPAGAVTAGTPAVLHDYDSKLPKNRLGFAKWLVDRRNPLVARVTVNRWWAQFFGQGIVSTQEDFGTQGERPTHPQLLDYLATEFMDSGWSMKHVHRLIVLSETYRQSSRLAPPRRAADPDPKNMWLGRGPRHRLSAEMIRDNALAVSGLLGTHMGGAPIFPPQPAGIWRHVGRNAPKYATSTGENRFRRGIYVIWRRSAPYPAFTNFDAPDRAACVVARGRTNTPLQALTLMNDPAYLEMAAALAAKIDSNEAGTTDEQRVRYAWRRVLSRRPNDSEVEEVLRIFRQERAHFRKNQKSAATVLGETAKSVDDLATRAAWLYVANILLNLDETITKG